MATTNPIGSLFGRNPFSALQKHMRIVVECADMVPGLFEAVAAGNMAEVEVIKSRIFEREEDADLAKNKLRRRLPRGLFMAVNRGDLLEVLDMQDSIADVAQDIAGLLYEREMEIPAQLEDQLYPYVSSCVAVCHDALKIIECLDELLEMGFRGKEGARVENLIKELNKAEHETDEMGIALSRTLFRYEDEMKPVSVLFWYRLIEWIGDLADYAEKVGNRLRLMIAK
ncbi:MAG: TIGR00153 family protein [Rhodothermia bacterium]|nr:MAG: TIGR00153 family protein [Rhodothermia bacterium]